MIKYSKPFDVAIQGKTMQMGCYGLGVSRILAAAVEVHHDEFGIRFPREIAPFHVSMIVAGNHTGLLEQASSLADRLSEEFGWMVLIDERDNVKYGTKVEEALLTG